MPLVSIVTNVAATPESKRQLVTALTALFTNEAHISAGHTHIHINDNQCFAFGGDYDAPAASITIKTSALQIYPEMRAVIVEKMAPKLQQCLGVPPTHTTTMFEELPVENIAVGTNIICFKSPRTSNVGK